MTNNQRTSGGDTPECAHWPPGDSSGQPALTSGRSQLPQAPVGQVQPLGQGFGPHSSTDGPGGEGEGPSASWVVLSGGGAGLFALPTQAQKWTSALLPDRAPCREPLNEVNSCPEPY